MGFLYKVSYARIHEPMISRVQTYYPHNLMFVVQQVLCEGSFVNNLVCHIPGDWFHQSFHLAYTYILMNVFVLAFVIPQKNSGPIMTVDASSRVRALTSS